jgi:hypothetical protein
MWIDRRQLLVAGIAGVCANSACSQTGGATYRVHRLAGNPIIRPGMDARMGENIQGPSLVRVPDWVTNRLGRYYLYFADHKGDYIRLAFADHIEGPWTIHAPGALQIAQSGFPTVPPRAPANADASRRQLPGFAPAGTIGIPSSLDDATLPHIASPDVHVDHSRKRFVMYFHGLQEFGVQVSRAAISEDGVVWRGLPPILGNPYMRVFEYDGYFYAIAMPGVVSRARDPLGPFETGPTLFEPTQRHTAVLRVGDLLHVFWTRVGDAPEQIYASRIKLTGDWNAWRATESDVVLAPAEVWEGAGLPVAASYRSGIYAAVNQVRDPAIFEEDGHIWLLYAVQGERGLAIAELKVAN